MFKTYRILNKFSEIFFHRIYGLAVIEVMTMLEQLSNIDEIYIVSPNNLMYPFSFMEDF